MLKFIPRPVSRKLYGVPIVIWPEIRTGQYRVNPYHASLFRITVTLYICNFCTSEIFLKLSKSNFSALEMVKQLPILLLICEPSIRSVNPALWSRRDHGTFDGIFTDMHDNSIFQRQFVIV